MWFYAQILTSIIATLTVWAFFTCLIHFRGNESWKVAAGKAFLLSLQTGLGLGMLLFCCFDVPNSPTHKNFSLNSKQL
jgi:hypothetical protein